MNFNKAIIIGRLTRDPETRVMPSGQNVVSLSIATNRSWKDQSGNKQVAVEYHNVSAFGKLADICSQYLNKGQLILIEGRIQTRSWEDQGGNKKYKTEIIAENMQMGPRSEGKTNESTNQNNFPSGPTNMPSQEEIPVIETDEPIEDDIIEKEDGVKEDGVDVKNIPF